MLSPFWNLRNQQSNTSHSVCPPYGYYSIAHRLLEYAHDSGLKPA